MTIKELKKYIKDKPDTDEVLIWGWFAEGERYYAPNILLSFKGVKTM
jgi:hypothetical protein